MKRNEIGQGGLSGADEGTVEPLRILPIEPKTVKLAHSVEVEIKTLQHSELQARTATVVDGFSDPLFYDAETEVGVFIDGSEARRLLSFQGASDLADIDYHRLLAFIEENLKTELERAAIELCEEARDFVPDQEIRESLIARRKADVERSARKRLPPAKRRGDFVGVITKATEALIKLTEGKGTLRMHGLKTAVAQEMYPMSDNALQELSRQCRSAGIADFFDLLCYAGRSDVAFEFYEHNS